MRLMTRHEIHFVQCPTGLREVVLDRRRVISESFPRWGNAGLPWQLEFVGAMESGQKKEKIPTGKMAKSVLREFEKARGRKIIPLEEQRQVDEVLATISSPKESIERGRDPMHALYTNTLNIMSVWTEGAEELPAFREAIDFIAQAQDLFMPGYPPMSPITNSYFMLWTHLDVPFGKDRETLGDCWTRIFESFDFHPIQREAAQNLSESRMGVYQVLRITGQQARLRELVTDIEIEAFLSSGPEERLAECLVYLRLVPPIEEIGGCHIAMTTPYVLLGHGLDEWMEYFQRQGIVPGAPGAPLRLHEHLKFGNKPYYWSDFVFYAYFNHTPNAVLLHGLPDRPETQPQRSEFDPK